METNFMENAQKHNRGSFEYLGQPSYFKIPPWLQHFTTHDLPSEVL